MCRSTLQRIGRLWGLETAVERSGRSRELRTVRRLGNRWVGVVEAHRSGWPHLNLLIYAPALAAELRREHSEALEDPEVADAVALSREFWRDKRAVPASVRDKARRASLVSGPLRDLLTEVGWGPQSTAEAARSADAVSGYVCKVAGLHEASAGELAKVTQVPLAAPQRFRRIRAGKGFLPPRRRSENVTGCLILSKRDMRGDWRIRAVNCPMVPEQFSPTRVAVGLERRLIEHEKQAKKGAPRRAVLALDGWLVTSATRHRLQSLSPELGTHEVGDSGTDVAMLSQDLARAG